MTTLTPTPTSTRQLHWDPTTREYVGEISSTNGFGRVYDDAYDEGLTLVSDRTGRSVTFVVDHTERDADGDVLYWLLKPAGPTSGVAATIRLFND